MTGGLYLWYMLAFFIGAVGIALLLFGIFFIGHWLEKKETGATHGFLELPNELKRPAKREGKEDEKPPEKGE